MSAPQSRAIRTLCSPPAVAKTVPAPSRFAICTATEPTPPAPAWTRTLCPLCSRAVDGDGKHLARDDDLRVRTALGRGRDALPDMQLLDALPERNDRPHAIETRGERHLGDGGPSPAALLNVGKVDARQFDFDRDLTRPGLRIGDRSPL